jgi:hypothetical protein
MNERIRELADEAAKFSAVMALPTGESGDALFVEKFAELIVCECCEYLNNEAERLYGLKHDDGDLLAEKCYDNIQGIKEHFGVEE